MKGAVWLLAIAGLAASGAAIAQSDAAHEAHHPATKVAAAPVAMSEGEVRKVDKSAGKVTIKHGPLQNLDMPAMTMVFRVKDPALLDALKEGERIKFTAETVNGALTVTDVQPTK